MNSKVFLGLDIGGTYIKIVAKQGREIVKDKEYTEEVKDSTEHLLDKIAEIIKRYNPDRVGIAVAGLYDIKEEKITDAPNLKVLQGIPLKEIIERRTGVSVVIQNDATLAAYGEYIYGAGKGSNILVCFTLGTGLGGGAVINGKPLIGVSGSAMEIGHITVQIDGLPCHCGRRGCLEAYVSSYGLERIFFVNTSEYRTSFEIINLANEGKKEAIEAMEDFSRYLSIGLMNIVHLFNPDRILLLGGIIENYPLIEELVHSDLRHLAFPLPFRDLEIKRGSLGEFSGAFGALSLAENLAL